MLETSELHPCLLRTKLSVENETKGVEKTVEHLLFVNWPDGSVPTTESELGAFKILTAFLMEFICDDKNTRKVHIHCRSGHGRSGTLLTILSQLVMHR